MAEKVTIELPADLIALSGLSPDRLKEKSLLIWVLELFAEGIITLSKAAEMAKLKNDELLAEFYKRRMKRQGGPETVEEAQQDLNAIR